MKASRYLLLLFGATSIVQAAEVRTLDFSVRNTQDKPVHEIVRVSLPVRAGLFRGGPPSFVAREGERIPAQADVITRHPDGSVRRMMLSFPLRIAANSTDSLVLIAEGSAGPAIAQANGKATTIRTDALDLHLEGDVLQITAKSGKPLGAVRPFGPSLTGVQAPTLAVLENGPFFAWLRWRQDGSDYSREVDVQADKFGRVRLVHRILRHLKGND